MSWYSSGYDGVNKEEQRLATLSGPRRFWMAAGSSRSVVLVDDEPFCIHEHNAKLNGRWDNQHTCMKNIEDPCESCARLGEKSRYYIGYKTMVDCTKFTDKKGNSYQYEVKLVGGKLGSLKKWKRKKLDRGSLIMTVWKVHREDDKKASIGDEWEFDKAVENEEALFNLANYKGKKLSELWDKAEQNEDAMKVLGITFKLEFDPESDGKKLIRRVPAFNYLEQLKPRGNEAIKEMLGDVTKEEATGQDASSDNNSGGSSGGGKEDDVPF
jgi:hypothetical protein